MFFLIYCRMEKIKDKKRNTGQQTKVWLFNPLCTNGFFFIQMIKLRRNCHIIGPQVTSSKFRCLMYIYLKIIFALTNSADPEEMQNIVALHLGLHYLSKNSLRSQ